MTERVIVTLIAFALVYMAERRTWTTLGRRERLLYGVLLAGSLYTAIDYTMELSWPTPDALMDALFLKPARWITEQLDVLP